MSLQIFILGILCEGNHHPYDIKKMFKKNNIEDVHKINDGTLYYNFDVLLKKGYIEKREVIREDNRPEKTTYGITPKGREFLEQEIYASFRNFTGVESLYSSTLFLQHADKNKLIFLIEEVIDKMRNRSEQQNQDWEAFKDKTPPSVHLIQDYVHNRMKLESEWLVKLLDFVKNDSR
ncbi:PadR family transcriptional regulator [Paenibacillus sp. 1P03SA]|uniref:PadR family transcriptional regulator n=1 Tax=Paenibacillus sp. 1P03SA TaxID=3132294 RepID=UPI0039A38AB9